MGVTAIQLDDLLTKVYKLCYVLVTFCHGCCEGVLTFFKLLLE
jgi:hypothetical protein